MSFPKKISIIGAGPAGLGAAYELSKHGHECALYDRNSTAGGLSRTFHFKKYFFDVGPHRFFTKNNEVSNLWHEVLGSDFVKVKRLTRIYYNGKFFYYPIRPWNAFWNLGFWRSFAAGWSFFWAKLCWFGRTPATFEDWMVKNFGRVLYEIFFKTYTEKVWGISCRELGSEWAGQRIKNLNFWTALKKGLFGGSGVKSLVEEFEYPLWGAGELYEKMGEFVSQKGGKIHLDTEVERVFWENSRITGLEIDKEGRRTKVELDYLFSSAPITKLILKLDPLPPSDVLAAAKQLFYRDHLTVNLLLDCPSLFPDQWLYIHDPRVKTARIANYASFSDRLSPDKTPLSVEYFLFSDKDELWRKDDSFLIKLALAELKTIGLLSKDYPNAAEGFVVREKDSYPTYYAGYQNEFQILRKYLDRFENLQSIGRAGMYKYDNQDHALLTGILAGRNLLGEAHDIWSINSEDEYLEEKKK